MTNFEALVFVSHYFFFFLTALFFFLKFQKRKKVVFYATLVLWIIFGFLGFFLELGRFIDFLQ